MGYYFDRAASFLDVVSSKHLYTVLDYDIFMIQNRAQKEYYLWIIYWMG